MKKPSATQHILWHLQKGKTITPLQALNKWGVFRLADVIFKLRKRGYTIQTLIVENCETGKEFAKYWMVMR